MNFSNAQIVGAAVAIVGFIFAGAYAVASHHTDRPARYEAPKVRVDQGRPGATSVPAASEVFRGSAELPEEQPVAF